MLVIVVLFALLGNFRAALIATTIIPLSMLFTITGMVTSKVSANLMSLGALDFGIIVDGAVIIVENCMRRLSLAQHATGRLLKPQERFGVVRSATKEVITPSIFGGLIIMVVYLPILTLTGVEGKMFVPMAFTVLLALAGAMIFALTFVPAAVAIFLNGKVSEKENRLIAFARRIYQPLLLRSLSSARVVVASAACLVVASLFLASQMGREFIPSLDEGDVLIQPVRIAGTSVSQSTEMSAVLEKRFLQVPEVKEVFTRIGTAEVASDPMPPNTGDCYVMLKPRSEWPDPSKSKAAVVEELTTAAEEVPGSNYEVTQPIQMRFNELISGVRSDVGVKIFGDDMDVLRRSGDAIAKVLGTVAGNDAVKVEQVTGLPC